MNLVPLNALPARARLLHTTRTVIALLFLSMNSSLFAAPRDALWKTVDDTIRQGLPRSAITNLQSIIGAALKDKAYAEAVKAIGRKLTLEGEIQGNKPEEKIVRLEAEIAGAPEEMAPVLDTLLAHWYWQYFQRNRWRFVERTATAAPPGDDFTTWDLPRLFARIDQQFQKALAAESALKTIPIAAWDDLLPKGTMPDAYRPTLYDFIAFQALEFYSSGEQAGARPEDAFELPVEGAPPILPSPFTPAEEFIQLRPVANPTPAQTVLLASMRASPIGKALALFQQLLRFHQSDPAPRLAFAAADLDRLAWAWNTAVGEDKGPRYKAALDRFIETYAGDPISALAMERAARVLQQEDDLVAAHALAQRGAQAFPESPGGRLCANLVIELEAKSAAITTERVWNCFQNPGQNAAPPAGDAGPCPTITVHYRNIDAVYFRAVPYDWEPLMDKMRSGPGSLSPEELRKLVAKTPALAWSEKLAPTSDYQQKEVVLDAPAKLTPGFYFIVASCDPAFGEQENQVSIAPVWVSDLALVTRVEPRRTGGFVLDANSGEPIAGAEISVWHQDQTGAWTPDPGASTDENGFFSFTPGRNRGYLLRARYQGREVATDANLWAYPDAARARPEARVVFFTDRAIYRPGQTVQYKGICLWIDQERDNYETLKGEELVVVFRDPNGKEIARHKQRANDFGSFAGSFTAPRDRLMGNMTLVTEGRARGDATVSVEEYKRPRFQVTLDAPKTAPKLNQTVSLQGSAMSYTGAHVDGAQVKYRVVRQVRMPWWWGWWRDRGQESQEIAHGAARTETDGSFKIEFTAKPDRKVPEKDEPTFVFEVTADVTDSAGETRSAERSVRIGYTALEATLAAPDWQSVDQPVELTVETRTLDGEPQAAEGLVKVYELQAPDKVQRAPLPQARPPRFRGAVTEAEGDSEDLSHPNAWPLGKLVNERRFTTGTNGSAKLEFKLGAGVYRARIETQDRFGKKVTGRLALQVLDPAATRFAIKIPHFLGAPAWKLQPGEPFMAVWGTGYDSGRAFIEIEHRRELIQRYWTRPGQTQQQLKLAVTEAMRGGFTLHVTQVRENRAYLDSRLVDVPWSNKDLELRWTHFVSKLQPGQKETWTLEIRGPKSDARTAEKPAAELVATLYDESLDAFQPTVWIDRFNVFRIDSSRLRTGFANSAEPFSHVMGGWSQQWHDVPITYRAFPPEFTAHYGAFFRAKQEMTARYGRGGEMLADSVASMTELAGVPAAAIAMDTASAGEAEHDKARPAPAPAAPKPDLGQVTARKNLNETAFFFPQLTSDSNGVVRLAFSMPEALTRWRFLGFAHDRALRSGFLENHAVTAKDLMVQPNPPRFMREGDTLEFTVKVSNQADRPQSGSVRLSFTDAATGKSADPLLKLRPAAQTSAKPGDLDQPFDLPAKQSRSFSWRLTIPDGCGFLAYKAVAATADLSDGEEGAVPVLSRRRLITESLPLPVRGPATRKFEFSKLLKSGRSKTLRNQSLTVQMVSQPAWYAVLALPYLMEYPYQCSEQTFNRLYANALARHIARSDPKIRRIFELWRNTPALESPLEKNQDLKSVALEETPWLAEAKSESEARRNVGVLFDDNRIEAEMHRALDQLLQMQLRDGSWPWFPGGPRNDYITLYITTGFGRLRHLGVQPDVDPALRALARLDAWMSESYDRILKSPTPDDYIPSSLDALYLYGRSFFLKDLPIAAPHRKAVGFFLAQSRKFWLKTNSRQTQAQIALALRRFAQSEGAEDATPQAIMASLKERSVSSEEMGMFWRDTEPSWWWYRAPIETQALMIEAFDEIAQDRQAVEECRVWLLKQKQTQDWKTTKATADAVYALLLRGGNLLSSDALVEVKLAGKTMTPAGVEPGTGFYEVRFAPPDIKPRLGEITVRKADQGVAWGSVHWQYLEDLSKVTPYEGTPLKLHKSLFVKNATSRGPVLEPVKGPVQVGDELVVRVELRVDRDMEYVHLKDQRGSGTEPVTVLSRYKYQDGLGYYESTRDTASHFFIDYLPKGTYVFEYSTRVQLRGAYQTGVAEIQCLYAPEFNSHSQSLPLAVN